MSVATRSSHKSCLIARNLSCTNLHQCNHGKSFKKYFSGQCLHFSNKKTTRIKSLTLNSIALFPWKPYTLAGFEPGSSIPAADAMSSVKKYPQTNQSRGLSLVLTLPKLRRVNVMIFFNCPQKIEIKMAILTCNKYRLFAQKKWK
jgi:hypothetical protein